MSQSSPTSTCDISLLIVDDHLVVRMGLSSLLGDQDDMEVVAQAASAAEAVTLAEEKRPFVALLDLRLPDLSGALLAGEIRKVSPLTKCIILTTFVSDEEVFQAFENGAEAYLLKDSSSEQLIDTIRRVANGSYEVPAAIQQALATRRSAVSLSPREIEILKLVARGDSNKEVGGKLGVAENTVKNHIKNILGKLNARDRTEAVTRSLRQGIITLD